MTGHSIIDPLRLDFWVLFGLLYGFDLKLLTFLAVVHILSVYWSRTPSFIQTTSS